MNQEELIKLRGEQSILVEIFHYFILKIKQNRVVQMIKQTAEC